MTMYKEYNTNQLSLELNLADDALFIDGTKLEADANLYSFTWKKAINKYEESLNDKTAELYDTLVQEGVDLALSKEECETSEGLVHLLEDTEQALAEVEKAIIVKLIVQ